MICRNEVRYDEIGEHAQPSKFSIADGPESGIIVGNRKLSEGWVQLVKFKAKFWMIQSNPGFDNITISSLYCSFTLVVCRNEVRNGWKPEFE